MNSRVDRLRIPFFEEQAEVAADAIRRGQLVYGPHLDELRAQLAARFDKRHVTLTANGFAAIFAALKAVPAEGAVLTAPASTCHAVPNAILAAGRAVEFEDLDRRCASLGASAARTRCPVAVIPDHFGLIADACRAWQPGGALLIEDASQSFISRASQSTQADIVTLSFYPSKLVNGIDGGALLTNDAEIHARAQRLIQYADQFAPESEPRFNLKMNNVNAAVTLATLRHLDAVTARLREIYELYAAACRHAGVGFLETRAGEVAARFIIVSESPSRRESAMQQLSDAGLQAARELGLLCPAQRATDFPEASALVDCSFSIPFHPLLEDGEIERVCRSIGRL